MPRRTNVFTILPVLINIAVILIGIGINYGIIKSESSEMQRRISELEKQNIPQIKWQVDSNQSAINKLNDDQKATAAAIAAIQSKIDVMATKVDYIAQQIAERAKSGKNTP